jgi:hypothetical protein
MRLVIIGADNAVGVNGEFYFGLDLSGCGLPENFWALQWNEKGGEKGHIEYHSPDVQNVVITEIPQWALSCIEVWQARVDEIAALKEAEKIAIAENLASQQL